MKRLSNNYKATLENYLQWSACKTPFEIFPHMGASVTLDVEYGEDGPSAAEFLFQFETHGVHGETCREPELLRKYRKGKAMRDFWTKEIGWWKKWAFFEPEEFLCFLMPECYLELFQSTPRDHMVRYIYDNRYPLGNSLRYRLRRLAFQVKRRLGIKCPPLHGTFYDDCQLRLIGLAVEADGGFRVVC